MRITWSLTPTLSLEQCLGSTCCWEQKLTNLCHQVLFSSFSWNLRFVPQAKFDIFFLTRLASFGQCCPSRVWTALATPMAPRLITLTMTHRLQILQHHGHQLAFEDWGHESQLVCNSGSATYGVSSTGNCPGKRLWRTTQVLRTIVVQDSSFAWSIYKIWEENRVGLEWVRQYPFQVQTSWLVSTQPSDNRVVEDEEKFYAVLDEAKSWLW